MKVAVLGAGGGGASAVVDLGLRDFTVRLWNRKERTLVPLRDNGGVAYKGVLGTGHMAPECYTSDLEEVAHGADALLVCLPTTAHEDVAKSLATAGLDRLPVVLNPGHTGGALAFRQVFVTHGSKPPPTAEFSTLTYVARRPDEASVSITGVAKQVRVACLPGDEVAVEAATALYSGAVRAENVLATGLANVNMVLHPPGAILGASWTEASGGNYTFYVEGLTEGTGRILCQLDRERLAVATAFGVSLPDLFNEMQAIGTIEQGADPQAGVVNAIRGGSANSAIRAPDSLEHRYYREDFWYGLLPFIAFADIAGIDVPVARALMTVAENLLQDGHHRPGRTAASMGIDGKSKQDLLRTVKGGFNG